MIGRYLRTDVACYFLRGTYIPLDHIDDSLIEHTALFKLNQGDKEAVLKHILVI